MGKTREIRATMVWEGGRKVERSLHFSLKRDCQMPRFCRNGKMLSGCFLQVGAQSEHYIFQKIC